MTDHTPDTWTTLLEAHRASRSHSPAGGPPPHRPKAAILSCSDARVPPSVVFDQAAGSLFVVRIAGNTASPSAVASLDYAVGELAVELLVVMGHTNCGAVGAAVEGVCQGRLEPILVPICELAREHPDLDADTLSALNVARTMAALRAHEGPVGRAAAEGRLTIRGAVHDLASGELTPVELESTGTGRTPAGRS